MDPKSEDLTQELSETLVHAVIERLSKAGMEWELDVHPAVVAVNAVMLAAAHLIVGEQIMVVEENEEQASDMVHSVYEALLDTAEEIRDELDDTLNGWSASQN